VDVCDNVGGIVAECERVCVCVQNGTDILNNHGNNQVGVSLLSHIRGGKAVSGLGTARLLSAPACSVTAETARSPRWNGIRKTQPPT
jgi:hypothetical protein